MKILTTLMILFAINTSFAANCGLAQGEDYYFCVGYTTNNCGVAGSQYLMCKALVDKNCGIVSGENYNLCRGITQSNCGIISNTNDYNFCKGLTTKNCGLASGSDYWLCKALTQ